MGSSERVTIIKSMKWTGSKTRCIDVTSPLKDGFILKTVIIIHSHKLNRSIHRNKSRRIIRNE